MNSSSPMNTVLDESPQEGGRNAEASPGAAGRRASLDEPMRTDPFDAGEHPEDAAPRGAPHLRQRGMRTEPCRYEQCDGSGWIEVEEGNGARECSCRRENLTGGRGLYFFGEIGSGKTSLAMCVAKEVLRERRSLAIFSGPELLARISATYEERSPDTYLGLLELLGSVDFLLLEGLAVAKQNEWRLEQLYAVINRRYEDRRPMLVTADVGNPEALAEHIGERTCSRILEMCEPMPFLDGDHRVKATTPDDVRLAS